MELEDYFKNGKAYIWKETFAIVKSKGPLPDAFAVIQDKNETTIVIKQSQVKDEDIIAIEKDWKIITFDMVLPFELTGFLSKVFKALTDKNISIFAISSYSTDHIIVKEKNISKAIKKLESLGCIIKRE